MNILDLCGEWILSGHPSQEPIVGQVPGCVHTDLLGAGLIDDPFVRDNELNLRWIGESDWTYTRRFEASEDMLCQERVLLCCDGLDTFANISINGKNVGHTDNMFISWEFDVKSLLQPGENEISVTLQSVIPYIYERGSEKPLHGWSSDHEVKHRCYVRKEPCNFGWDWGPALVTHGIWRPIKLIAFSDARLSDVHIRQKHSYDKVDLNVSIGAEVIGTQNVVAVVTVTHDDQTVAEETITVSNGKAAANLAITDPKLWWPNGMGSQPLYNVDIELRDDLGNCLDKESKRIGLRTIELVRETDEWGESFAFAVNGIPFFSKGANWIPADTFATRLTEAEYHRLIKDAAAVNMNMIRAWGGGIYEADCFFDICDEEGLLVWQDFMFACSAYPIFDEKWMASVKVEAEQAVKRLRHHPSLALWCGNNELEMGLVGDKPGHGLNSWEDYSKLFDDMLPGITGKFDPDTPYWPSSPHTPHGDRHKHSDDKCGDVHIWDVWHGLKPFEFYRTCNHRFVSEFGFQSFPCPTTVNSFTAEEDRNVTSFVMEHHQRSFIGNSAIMTYMLDWFRMPTSFDMTLWLSQILQGTAIKYAVEHWRRNAPRTMGAIYWQLNDCWPVASWASIDYYGNWKALHFMARRFFAPLMVSCVENLEQAYVDVHITNDYLVPADCEVKWQVTDVSGSTVVDGKIDSTVEKQSTMHISKLDLGEHVAVYGKRGLMLWIDLLNNGEKVSSDVVVLSRPKHIELLRPKFATNVQKLPDGRFRVRVETDSPALWTWLDVPGHKASFSDNFFHIRPGEPVEVDVSMESEMDTMTFGDCIRVHSLVDTYGYGN